MKNKKNQRQKGFTLIETIITMSIFLVILSGVYMMIQHYGDVSKTEHSRITMQQESRYMVSSFSDEIKEAGAVLTLAHTGGFLGAEASFNGLYPLNSTTYPDGIIVATGDPEAVTKLTGTFKESDMVLPVENATVAAYDASFPYENPQWAPGQKGILIGTTGYLVFEVAEVPDASSIRIRNTPVYYSGLLDINADYKDTIPVKGTDITYAENSPVIRLTNFSIYVFRDVQHPKLTSVSGSPQIVRQMIRITDTYGQEDPFAEGSNADYSVISENIWDMQISYVAFENFETANQQTAIDSTHHYFAGGTTSSDASALMTDIKSRFLRQIDISIIAIADELGGRGELSAASKNIPDIGDNTNTDLPNRKIGYRMFSFSVEPRNFNVLK